MFFFDSLIKGLGVGFGLIIAIGMQNAFVLKQALIKRHLFLIAITCSILDAILIFMAVNGVGTFLFKNHLIEQLFKIGGIIFLLGYGVKSFISSTKNHSIVIEDQATSTSIKKIVGKILFVTLCNPHTYLDNFVVMASIASNISAEGRMAFSLGAMLASFIWFFSLSYGAGCLSNLFKKEISWKILDLIIGFVMFSIAISLILSE